MPECGALIHPYIGGEELLNAPDHAHRRYVIGFGERSEAEARQFQPIFDIVERRVKPARAAITGSDGTAERRRRYWWQWGGGSTPALFAAARGLERLLMVPFTASNLCFAFVPSKTVIAGPHVAVALSTQAAFCGLQARPHEVWVRFFSSSMKDDLRYSLSDCFNTFPFPPSWKTDPVLEAAGQTYYDFRAQLMIANNQGLTATYNRFHDPTDESLQIARLRELHAAMDRAVLRAYGWDDVPTACEFIAEHAEEANEDLEGQGGRPRRRHYRYRWPDAVRDDVLARLLDLNAKRAAEEVLERIKAQKAAAAARVAAAADAVLPVGQGAGRARRGPRRAAIPPAGPDQAGAAEPAPGALFPGKAR